MALSSTMNKENSSNNFKFSCFSLGFLLTFCFVAALLVYFLIPSSSKSDKISQALLPQDNITDLSVALLDSEDEKDSSYQNYIEEAAFDNANNNVTDDGLYYYRQSMSRDAVEWFYFQITGNRDIAQAVLLEADKNDIPVSLAFALAFTESGFNVKAINNNSNNTTDRGLFQLNSNSFPKLSEADFFDPYISAKYGMSHLKFCLTSAGNEVSALAMYNAGTSRVRANKTPQSTLNYIGKIISYQNMLEKLFAEEVVAYYETQIHPSYSLAFADK